MQLFAARKIATVADRTEKSCYRCSAKLLLVRVMVDTDTGAVMQMFECAECRERTWNE